MDYSLHAHFFEHNALQQFKGHMSHVMSVRWSKDDTYLFSVGGLDCCTFQWKHVGLSEPTEGFEPIPNGFGQTMEEPAAFPQAVGDPDEGMQIPRTPLGESANQIEGDSESMKNIEMQEDESGEM